MHRRNLVAAIAIIAALFVVADGNLPTRNRVEPCGIVLLGAALPRRTLTQTARTAALEGTCEVAQLEQGFTLIELSIVLVIIGLIVGGVLVGADMIKAAATRAQIAQIERYNSAVNTFVTKYGYLPGDIPDPYASQFGFQARGASAGQGDGNGELEGWNGGAAGNQELAGESPTVWVDLSQANMIDGNFNTASPTTLVTTYIYPTSVAAFLPSAKLGQGNYIYAYGGGYWNGSAWIWNGYNYFGLSAISFISGSGLSASTAIPVTQAYNIDKKIDDGLPQSGTVTAQNAESRWQRCDLGKRNG